MEQQNLKSEKWLKVIEYKQPYHCETANIKEGVSVKLDENTKCKYICSTGICAAE
jgi:hypothetical protein